MSKYAGNDIYCDEIIPKKIGVDILYESDRVLAFNHTQPHWPVHIVVVPKVHIDSLLDIGKFGITAQELLNVVIKMAGQVTEDQGGARVISNLGTYQDSKHLHFHVCSGDPII